MSQTMGRTGHRPHTGRGPSSYWMQDPDVVFEILDLHTGDCFLDLGCGPGDYAIRAAREIGDSGAVYAMDNDPYMINALKTEAAAQVMINLEASVADITRPLPVEDKSIDLCFLSTILHIPYVSRHIGAVLSEIRRVLKPGGRLAVLECLKEDVPFGPPKEMRWSPEDVECEAARYGFRRTRLIVMKHHYLIRF